MGVRQDHLRLDLWRLWRQRSAVIAIGDSEARRDEVAKECEVSGVRGFGRYAGTILGMVSVARARIGAAKLKSIQKKVDEGLPCVQQFR